MKYIKSFNNRSELDAYYNNAEAQKYYVLEDKATSGKAGIVERFNDKKLPLTFTAEQAGSTVKILSWDRLQAAEYSYDGETWNNASGITITLANVGDKVMFRGQTKYDFRQGTSGLFAMTGKIAASGSIMSMYNMNPDDTVIDSDKKLFYMFRNCTSLTTAPELPATTLASQCYSYMFSNCSSLTQAPELPSTTLVSQCYSHMFDSCTSLTTAPELPATTLAESCYDSMFYRCSSLTSAPELPSTTLANSCYSYMLAQCTSLTTAPELPATTLAESCYNDMFQLCTSLTSAPELPATTLGGSCYNGMFYGCTSLTTAPELPATILATNCYNGMFNGCTSLTTAPELPATILANTCYRYMFNDCTSLTQAPSLPATTLADSCYYRMFYNCSSLNDVTVHATSWNTSRTSDWLKGVAATGTLHNLGNATNIPLNSASGCPTGWTIVTE